MGIYPMRDASLALTEPSLKESEFLGQPFSDPSTILDYLSISHVANEFIKACTGYDVVSEATKMFSGDWAAVWRAGGAYSALGACLQQVAMNVAADNVALDSSWDGRAADAAFNYFADFSADLSSLNDRFRELGEQYHRAAEGTWRLANLYAGFIKEAVDWAIIGSAAAAAGTATIETGVGPIVGYGAAAYAATKVVDRIDKASRIPVRALQAATLIAGAVKSCSVDIETFSRREIPGDPYDSPVS